MWMTQLLNFIQIESQVRVRPKTSLNFMAKCIKKPEITPTFHTSVLLFPIDRGGIPTGPGSTSIATARGVTISTGQQHTTIHMTLGLWLHSVATHDVLE